MTKEEAIKVLDDMKIKIAIPKSAITQRKRNEALDMAIKALEQTRWIPVSERLPKSGNDVLATDDVDMFVAWYASEGLHEGWHSTDKNFDDDTPIVAWMPLPQPYNAESEDAECQIV